MLQKIRSIFRHFGGSIIISLLALIFVYIYMGWQAALLTLALMVIEITFSFDNAIVNAKVLMTMSKFWQNIFMTIGILIAVFGMRIVFPIVIVMVTAGLPWNDVINLALNDQEAYAAAINEAHTSIAAFGGMFLLMLALHFFFDHTRKTLWFPAIEKRLLSIGKWWMSAAISLLLLCIVTFLPFNAHPTETFVAGVVGILTYLGIFGLSAYFTKRHEASEKKAGKK